nr:hypothetical protein [Deltaproteobacteria bacterium]
GMLHLKNLENLQILDLSRTGISGEGLLQLASLKKLRVLRLKYVRKIKCDDYKVFKGQAPHVSIPPLDSKCNR